MVRPWRSRLDYSVSVRRSAPTTELLRRTVERLAYFATRLGASGLGGALVLAPVVALFLALFLAFAVKALAHNLQRVFGRKKKRRKRD